MIVRMMETFREFEEIVPDGVFRYESVRFAACLTTVEVATATILHENVENPNVSVELSVENVPGRHCHQALVRRQESDRTHTSATIFFMSHLFILSVRSSLHANICENSREPGNTKVALIARTKPSIFSLSFVDDSKGDISNEEEMRSHDEGRNSICILVKQ